MTAKKPIRTLADLKGVKIRAAGGADVALFNALGGIPVKIDAMEQYEGLQRGTIDGTFFPYASIAAYKLEEVVSYTTETNIGGSVFAIVMNKKVWESLPRDLQLVIDWASRDSAERFAWSYYNQDAAGKQKLAGTGEIIIPTAEEMGKMRAASMVVVDKWLEGMKAKGLPGQEVYELMLAQPELYGLGK
jgi:TRAP-type C4-dicarboxylate transport system substrate-binding protein